MRSAQEIQNLIVEKAKSDERIRAVLLNGSRANPNVPPDKLQDFDVVYVVNRIESFLVDHGWVNDFGKRLIWQLPNEMGLYTENQNARETFSFLMLFEDGNRIDLTLIPAHKINATYDHDSLTVVWLDKDEMFSKLPLSNESDYFIKRPTEKEFLETCNEFLWVTTYVAKGLARGEIPYAKHMMETVVRPMFMRIIEWHIGTKTDFSVPFGKYGNYIPRYVTKETQGAILKTYSDHQLDNNWTALAIMTKLFAVHAPLVADNMGFRYNKDEEVNVLDYIAKIWVNE